MNQSFKKKQYQQSTLNARRRISLDMLLIIYQRHNLHLLYIIAKVEIICIRQLYMGTQFLVEVPRLPKKKYTTNYISTTKYNIITFLPLSLLVQFKRYANIYFLICAILQSISIISPLNPASAIAPLSFVLFLSMAREGYEDYKRWKSDKENNKSRTHIIEGRQVSVFEWKKIKQGDLIRLVDGQSVPADLLVLISSEESGISYVETSSLDGQKNLKPKLSIPTMQELYNKTQEIPNFYNLSGKILCSEPAASNIEGFLGKVSLKLGQKQFGCEVNKKYMLHRGSKVKNTEWIIGLACYCGKQTAVMMGGNEPYTKTSNIERMVNKMIIVVFIFEVLCAMGSAVYCYFKCIDNLPFQELIRRSQSVNCITVSAITLGSYYILYNTFIPISLIVSLQFVKVFQGIFMQRDNQLYCGLNQRKAECHTVSINEQLGQVDYILTDKTGTLTCNRMEFRNIVVGNQLYGEDLIRKQVHQDFDYSNLSRRYSVSSRAMEDSNMFDSSVLSFELNQDKSEINKSNKSNRITKSKDVQEIFFAIATCHQCITCGGQYQGASPDEVALLKAAKKVGFQFISTQNKVTKVKYKNQISSFRILKVIEFDSDRKRMTVILQTSNTIKVYVKGADTSIEKLLAPNQTYLAQIKQKTSEMSKTGLRSLWFAYKQYELGTKIQELKSQQIESELTLLGASGIEDKLQDFVPQTIHALREGGIKFIMLTGDKLQTAENIAISCRLIDQGFLINSQALLNTFVKKLQEQRRKSYSFTASISPVIDGSTISFAQNEQDLLHIIPRVNSMVFCRVTPAQKAEIVKLVKKLGKITLAIGDGANDTNMITQAHIGVGIFGQQGTQAAQVSNYAIGEFCILWKLILHYGRLNYIRISEMILYSFYKNMVFTIVQFAYCFYNGSGQSFWSSWPITLFNLIFTFFPVVMRAVFQVDLNIQSNKRTFKEISQGRHQNQVLYSYYPKMYYIGQKNTLFTKLTFFHWFTLGMSQGVICFIVTLYSLGTAYDTSGFSSYQSGFYFLEISAYTSVIIIVTIKIAINIKQWNIILILGFSIPSLGAYVGYRLLFNYIPASDIYGYLSNLLTMPSFYLCQMLCIMGMFSFDFFLFSLEATKSNFQNYLKFRTIKQRDLSVSHLNKYVLEMESAQLKKTRLLQY